MPKLKNLIKAGVLPRSQRLALYGPNGIGKTTLAESSPGPVIYIDTEHGSDHRDLHRIGVSSYAELDAALEALLSEEHDYATLVIDTVDGVEQFLRTEVCTKAKVTSLSAIPYGHGVVQLREVLSEFLARLDAFIDLNISVVVIGHSQVKKVSLPGLESYDRHELQMDEKNAFRLREWADAVLFLGWDVKTLEDERGKSRGVGGTKRMLYTTHAAAFDAKNRVGLPERMTATPADFVKVFGAKISPASKNSPAANGNADASPQPDLQPQARLAKALADIDSDHVHAFLLNRKKITDGQTVADLDADYCTKALSRIQEFRQAIDAYDYVKV